MWFVTFCRFRNYCTSCIKLNRDYGANHRFMLVQSEEKLNPSSAPFKKAIELDLEPTVSAIMLHRINVRKLMM